ncbi:beta-galactosidase [Paenibacillus gansuensis]|uniref:Beta-galactosidase n=1 Tax=Paenibacillus gansuensis TaxID=306542 RepID=A0ABW5PLQ3_9BACL
MKPSLIVFYDPTFPLAEGQHIESGQLAGFRVAGALELAEALRTAECGCFINMHAPYFPKAAWADIASFLQRGGGLISMGGAPFKRPVREENGTWIVEAEQTAYHQELYIHEALRVNRGPIERWAASEEISLFSGKEHLFELSDTWNLVPHVVKTSDLPDQMGSAGPMDAQIYPLLKGVSSTGRIVAAPAVLWEYTKGTYTGGRWLFLHLPAGPAFWEQGGAAALREWAEYCAAGVTELWIKPNYASYEPGERGLLTLQKERTSRRGEERGEEESWVFDFSIRYGESSEPLWTYRLETKVQSYLTILRIPLPFEIESGFYRVVCVTDGPGGVKRTLRQGFWGMDREMLQQGSPVKAGRDYFEKEGRPLPVVGMTYMTSDVARKFLFLPNVEVWDRDMAQMKRAGINWIRTGIWTAYRNIMQVDGHVSEEVLRAIDAFISTAKKHDLQVTFTFFSFTPETWEGENPYLDPRSIAAQKRFIRSIISRHRQTANVDWDLINEPSMFDPPRIFSNGPRSARDPYERRAFSSWLKQRHGTVEKLQELWNMTPQQLPDFESALPPEPEEINFDVQDMHQAKKGTRWLDYTLFSMDMHNSWASELYKEIKSAAPDHMVTVGQDEALGAQRPSPFFYGEAVDYTTVHSWWLNDQLLWDGIFAKTPDKPNLVQETGIMYVETPDGRAKRSELELRNILERKYAYAFAAGGAGAVQWIWNTNFYMDNANESHIGALRADGSEKPEADVSYDFGRFMAEIRDLFDGRKLEDVAVVFPYSNDFSNRKLAFDATTRLTRILAYEMNVPFRGVGEYQLASLRSEPAKLILLPSPHNFDDQAFAELIEITEETGAVLLITGPIGIDAYWRASGRAAALTGETLLGNVRREESLSLGGELLPVSFGNRRIAELAKEIPAAADPGTGMGQGPAEVLELHTGKGRVLWCPLPVELNERNGSIRKLYGHVLALADCETELVWLNGGHLPGIYGRKLSFREGALFTFVSEYALDTEVKVMDRQTGAIYSFILEKERSVLFAADLAGRIMSVYRPDEVRIGAALATGKE